MAIATETDGSIAGPSQINGVVGLKPTPGVVSRAGVIAVSDTWDTVGPMARSVFDVALALSIVAGHDPRDSRTSTVPSRKEDYTTFVASKDALKGARFGYPVKGAWEHVPEGVRKVAEKIFDGIRACGGEVVPVEYPCAEERIPPNGKWDWYDVSKHGIFDSLAYILTGSTAAMRLNESTPWSKPKHIECLMHT